MRWRVTSIPGIIYSLWYSIFRGVPEVTSAFPASLRAAQLAVIGDNPDARYAQHYRAKFGAKLLLSYIHTQGRIP
jgi:hypothetical protein